MAQVKLASLLLNVMVFIYCKAFPLLKLNVDSDEGLRADDFFEGDLKIPKEIVRQYYDLKSFPGRKNTLQEYLSHKASHKIEEVSDEGEQIAGAAVRLKPGHLWNREGIPYHITNSSLSPRGIKLVRRAIKEWEDSTCIVFTEIDNVENIDYVDFNHLSYGCYSYIGKKGGRQDINVEWWCEYGNIVHEIGHALGFWHEHTRPDRDEYVDLLLDNEESGALKNFYKRKFLLIDYQGSKYDYGSIMHYPPWAFSNHNCEGVRCDTIHVKNLKEYKYQGSPTLGQQQSLSRSDIEQANHFYILVLGKGSLDI